MKRGATLECNNLIGTFLESAENGDLEAVQSLFPKISLLLPKMIQSDDMCRVDALRRAAEKGHLPIVQYLFPINITAWCLEKVLNTAVIKGHLSIVEYFFTTYSEIIPNSLKNQTFFCAAKFGHSPIVHYLLSSAEFDISKPNINIEDALIIAASGGHLDTVKCLITLSGNKFSEFNSGIAIIKAASNNHFAIVQYLLTTIQNNLYPWDKKDAIDITLKAGGIAFVMEFLDLAEFQAIFEGFSLARNLAYYKVGNTSIPNELVNKINGYVPAFRALSLGEQKSQEAHIANLYKSFTNS